MKNTMIIFVKSACLVLTTIVVRILSLKIWRERQHRQQDSPIVLLPSVRIWQHKYLTSIDCFIVH